MHDLEHHKSGINLPRGLAPLGYRDFTLYWVGVATTNAGRWIELTGLVWLVYELTNSPFLVGLLGAARALPALVLSPVAGVVADRVDRRLLLLVTQGLSLLCSVVMAFLVAMRMIETWQIYVQVMIQAAIMSFDSATRQALFPSLVRRSVLPSAVTLNVTATRVSKFVGPAIAGFLIAGLGEASPFFVNAFSFLGFMGAVAIMRPVPEERQDKQLPFAKDVLEGLRYILSTPVLSGILKLEIVFSLFEINPAIVAIIGRELLGVGPEALGILLSAPALGSFLGISWLLYMKGIGRQGRVTLSCTLVYANILIIVAFSYSYAVTLVALALLGILEVFLTVTRNTVMQIAAPVYMRGRVMANMGTVTRGLGPLSETQSGFLASTIGPAAAVLTAAGFIGTGALLILVSNRDLRNFALDESKSGEHSTG